MGIQEMVVRDTEDALEREALEEISSNHLNTKRMDLAHHNATGHYRSLHSLRSGIEMSGTDARRLRVMSNERDVNYQCFCRDGIRDVLRPRHHHHPFYLYDVTPLRSTHGNPNNRSLYRH